MPSRIGLIIIWRQLPRSLVATEGWNPVLIRLRIDQTDRRAVKGLRRPTKPTPRPSFAVS
jgi:hypothetical protein